MSKLKLLILIVLVLVLTNVIFASVVSSSPPTISDNMPALNSNGIAVALVAMQPVAVQYNSSPLQLRNVVMNSKQNIENTSFNSGPVGKLHFTSINDVTTATLTLAPLPLTTFPETAQILRNQVVGSHDNETVAHQLLL